MSDFESISKLDAARRQLRSAILLFFERGDDVSIHTLASASQDILRDLGRPKGVKSFIKDNPNIRADKVKEVRGIFSATQNFLKHADRDPAVRHEFRPGVIPFIIEDAVELYRGLAELFPAAQCFWLWFAMKFPEMVLGDLRALVNQSLAQGLNPDNYEAVRELIRQHESIHSDR